MVQVGGCGSSGSSDERGGRRLSFIRRVKRRYENLTRSEKKLADYLTRHWQDSSFKSAEKLGRDVGISETVVIRFAGSLGYDSYTEMKEEFQEAVQSQISDNLMVERVNDIQYPSDPQEVVRQAIQRGLSNVESVLQANEPEAFVEAARRILAARRIRVFGMRASSGPAWLLAFNLKQILPQTEYVHQYAGTMIDQFRDLGSDDLIITFCVHRYSSVAKQVADLAMNTGCPHLAVTDSHLSPTGRLADLTLLTTTRSTWFGHSHTGTLALIDILCSLMLWFDEDRVRSSLAELESMLVEYGLTPSLEGEKSDGS